MKPSDTGRSSTDEFLAEHRAELVAFRRHLHSFPELSRQEYETTELVGERLRAAGLTPHPLRSGTGLWCDIEGRGAAGGPTIALRADIDALAMDDTKSVTYRSKVDGRSHSCGHDVHTTIVLGAGLALAGRVDRFGGTVRLIFEPAEETVPGGSVDVIADGGLDGVASIFAFHCDPKIDVGTVGLRVGPLTSATDAVDLTLRGPGGHTARPHLTVDLVAIAGRVACELPELVARRAAETVAGGELLLVFGSLRAGDAANVIPTRAVLKGSARMPEPEVWRHAETIVARAVDELIGETGAVIELDYTRGIPAVVNRAEETYALAAAARRVLGDDAVIEAPRSLGGDTFAWYLDHVPGCLARLGVHDPARGDTRLDLHSGAFDVHEGAIDIGVRVFVDALLDRLGTD